MQFRAELNSLRGRWSSSQIRVGSLHKVGRRNLFKWEASRCNNYCVSLLSEYVYHAILGMGQQWRPSHRGALYHAAAPLQHGCFGGKDQCSGFVWLWQRWKAGVWWLMNHAWFSMQSTNFCGCENDWISPRVGWRWAHFQPDVRWSWWWRNFSGSMNVESGQVHKIHWTTLIQNTNWICSFQNRMPIISAQTVMDNEVAAQRIFTEWFCCSSYRATD